jgi:lipopolysaccharide biosynthesis regulator YciM
MSSNLVSIDHNALTGMEKHVNTARNDIKAETVHARYAMGRGDVGAGFNALSKIERHADDLASVSKQSLATVKSMLLAYAEQECWIQEFLTNLEAIYPDVYELLMSAEIALEDSN